MQNTTKEGMIMYANTVHKLKCNVTGQEVGQGSWSRSSIHRSNSEDQLASALQQGPTKQDNVQTGIDMIEYAGTWQRNYCSTEEIIMKVPKYIWGGTHQRNMIEIKASGEVRWGEVCPLWLLHGIFLVLTGEIKHNTDQIKLIGQNLYKTTKKDVPQRDLTIRPRYIWSFVSLWILQH